MKQLFTLLFAGVTVAIFGQAAALDNNFGVGGFVITDGLQSGSKIAVMPDDRIVMVGGVSEFNVVRFMPDGSLDNSFGQSGIASIDFTIQYDYPWDVAVQPDGKIVIVGVIDGDPTTNDQSFGVARLNADGTPDTTFNATGKLIFDIDNTINNPRAIALQPDGKIVVAGYVGGSGSGDYAVARLNENGTFDTSFDTDGKLTVNVLGDDRASSVAIQPDGKIVIGGSSYPVGQIHCWFAAVRLMPDGTLDATFGGDGNAVAKIGGGNDSVYDMALQPDGKILLAADSYLSSQNIGVVRFTASGDLDTTFSGDGKFSTSFNNTTDYVNAIAIQPDGKILVAGSFYISPDRKLALLRLTSAGELDTTFSDDGKANYVVPGENGVSVYDMKLQSAGQILVSGYAQSDFMLARVFSGNELGLPEVRNEAFSFYPNPARGNIYFNNDVDYISIFSIDGRKTFEKMVSGQADISSLGKGIYIVQLTKANGKTSLQKLVLE